MAIQGPSIGHWDEGQLIRFLNDRLEKYPPSIFEAIRADRIDVAKLLVIENDLFFSKDANFHKVGGTGEPAFQNSCVNFGSPWEVAGFWKDPFGFVHLRGRVKSFTVGSVPIFTLPPGSRPENQQSFPIVSNGAVGQVDILTGGNVQIPVGSNVWASLSGVSFLAKSTA